MRITVTTNAEIVALKFANSAAKVDDVIRDYMQSEGRLLHALVKRGASGWMGGPNVITGRYRSSIRMEFTGSNGDYKATVGTDEEYGLKLEVGGLVGSGFKDEPVMIAPHPHFGPALSIIEQGFEQELLKRVMAVIMK